MGMCTRGRASSAAGLMIADRTREEIDGESATLVVTMRPTDVDGAVTENGARDTEVDAAAGAPPACLPPVRTPPVRTPPVRTPSKASPQAGSGVALATPTAAEAQGQGVAETAAQPEARAGSAAALESTADPTSTDDSSSRRAGSSSRHLSGALRAVVSTSARLRMRQTLNAINRMTTVVHNFVLRDEHSTRRAAVMFLCQSMAFATVCSVFPCYTAWCCGMDARDRAARYFGEDAPSDPAVYRDYREHRHIEHLAVAPYQYFLALEYGAAPSGATTQPLWRSANAIYNLSLIAWGFVGVQECVPLHDQGNPRVRCCSRGALWCDPGRRKQSFRTPARTRH